VLDLVGIFVFAISGAMVALNPVMAATFDRPSDRAETTQVRKTGIEREQDAWQPPSVSTCPV
jgi:hypothetical protein